MFDAGKDIDFGVPIRVGDVLTAVSTVHDLYEKTGRSGSMAFVVLRTVVTNQRDERVVTIDQKMMFK
jgi:3-methylfumaryl-CoA hydratase